MTSPTGNRRTSTSARAFTLIELIVVLGLLAIVVSVGMPALQGFFHGRTLDSEARRFLTLTRYGQSRAVSEGMPMSLWVDAREGTYGLQVQTGYVVTDNKANEYEVDKDLEIIVSNPPMTTASGQANFGSRANHKVDNIPAIRFTPDGFISETSPERFEIRDTRGFSLWIVLSGNRQNYELQTSQTSAALR